jgi:hypothetical protein
MPLDPRQCLCQTGRGEVQPIDWVELKVEALTLTTLMYQRDLRRLIKSRQHSGGNTVPIGGLTD